MSGLLNFGIFHTDTKLKFSLFLYCMRCLIGRYVVWRGIPTALVWRSQRETIEFEYFPREYKAWRFWDTAVKNRYAQWVGDRTQVVNLPRLVTVVFSCGRLNWARRVIPWVTRPFSSIEIITLRSLRSLGILRAIFSFLARLPILIWSFGTSLKKLVCP